jgi:hypothetical protein
MTRAGKGKRGKNVSIIRACSEDDVRYGGQRVGSPLQKIYPF